jgi:hypothetical protein
MPNRDWTETADALRVEPNEEWIDQHCLDLWVWRNCREIGLEFHLLLMPWQWRLMREKSEYNNSACWQGCAQFGPFFFAFDATSGAAFTDGYGNATNDWRARFVLSDQKALRNSHKAQWRRWQRRLGR